MRRRLSLVTALAVAVSIALAAVIAYALVADQLRGTLDRSLEGSAAGARQAIVRALEPRPRRSGRPGPVRELAGLLGLPSNVRQGAARGELGQRLRDLRVAVGNPPLPEPRGRLGSAPGYLQVVSADGTTRRPPSASVALPVTAATRDVAAGRRSSFLADARVDGSHLRIYTVALGVGRALQLARPVDETDRVLRRIRIVLLLVCVGGVALAAALGLLIARAALDPVRRLTRATEEVATTQRLDVRIEATGDDELGRLARSFNRMLDALSASVAALDDSLEAQRQLVADASHELRTPITSLRTNIEVLEATPDLPADERGRLLEEVRGQLEELTALVADLIELGRGDQPSPRHEPVDFREVVVGEVNRLRGRAPRTRIETELEPAVVEGIPERLARAVGNMLDNAIKHGPKDGPVEVRLAGGELTVRDHGEGIDQRDLPHVFDRFYRSMSARGRPGSGLGLAIVRQVAEAHGGRVVADNAPGGGAALCLALPVSSATAPVHRLHERVWDRPARPAGRRQPPREGHPSAP